MTTNFSQTAAYIWSLADLLRGDFKQSQYGRVILPFTILRRLECVLAMRKPQVAGRGRTAQRDAPVGSCCARRARPSTIICCMVIVPSQFILTAPIMTGLALLYQTKNRTTPIVLVSQFHLGIGVALNMLQICISRHPRY